MFNRFLTLWKSWVLLIQGRPYLLASLPLLYSGIVAGTLSFVGGIEKRVATLFRVLAFVFGILGAILGILGEFRKSRETSNDIEMQQEDCLQGGTPELEEPRLRSEELQIVEASHVADPGSPASRADTNTTSVSSHGSFSSHLTEAQETGGFRDLSRQPESHPPHRDPGITDSVEGRVIRYPDRPTSVDLAESQSASPHGLDSSDTVPDTTQNDYTAVVDPFGDIDCEFRDVPIIEEPRSPSFSRSANIVPNIGVLPSNPTIINNYGSGTIHVQLRGATTLKRLYQTRRQPSGSNDK
ncbi:hypothetical protein V5O48_014723 [Marasmius crinis-equi]|uniref:Uncharacterized protein n=1 Tax=Marasmius crinis-equi TaxID=585013 RepID=A0ABR3EWI0_9AGAR